MSARDELEAIVASRGGHVKATTSAILAAGYSKPRAITTAEELDALPDMSVVMEAHPEPFAGITTMPGVFHKFPYTGWQCVASYKKYDSQEITLPATVLYTPEESK